MLTHRAGQAPPRCPPPHTYRNGPHAARYPLRAQGLRRFCSLVDSPYHGLNLCLGTAAEGLTDPARELPAIVRHFGERKKIFNIHFRQAAALTPALLFILPVGCSDAASLPNPCPDSGKLDLPILVSAQNPPSIP